MVNKWYDKTYRFLIILSVIFGIILGVFVIGHTSMLIYERIKYPEKSKARWHLIEEKLDKGFKSSPIVFLYPSMEDSERM